MVDPFACIQSKAVPERLKQRVSELRDKLRTMYPDEDDLTIANRAAEALEQDLSLREQNALRSASIQQDIATTAASLPPRKANRYLLSKIEGSELRDIPGDLNVWGVHGMERAIADQFLADFHKQMQRRLFTPGVSRERGRMRNVEREIFGEKTGDAVAAAMARSMRDYEKYVVDTYRSLGARINYDPERQWIVQHNRGKVGTVSREEWIGDIVERLDLARMTNFETNTPFTRDDIIPVLSEIYDTITTAGTSSLNPGVRQRQPLWQRLDQSRFFVWKDHAAWEGYNSRFGYDDSFTALVQYADITSRNIALLRVLGPDPESTVHYMKDLARVNQGREPGRGGTPGDTADVVKIERAFDIATGANRAAENLVFAEAGTSFRNIVNSAVLGGTSVLSLVNDNVTAAHMRTFNGLAVANQLPDFISNVASLAVGGPRSERVDFAIRAGIGLQSVRSSILGSMRGLGEFDGRKFAHLIADTNYRASGLTVLTDAFQVGIGQDFLHALTLNLGRSFDQFSSPDFARALQAYGIDEARWREISAEVPQFQYNGTGMIDLIGYAKTGNYENAARMMQMINQEMHNRGVITGSAATQRRLQMGTRPGSFAGEVARTGTGLLSWSTTYIFGQLAARIAEPGINSGRKATMLASLFVTMTLSGAVVVQLRQLAAGRDPYEWDDPRLYTESAMIGGGLGLIGDFLFREHYGSTDTYFSGMMGPGIATASSMFGIPAQQLQSWMTGEDYNVGRDVTSFLRQNTPLSSIFYLRLAMDRLVFDEMQKALDPNAYESFRRQEQQRLRDRGQGHWWRRGQTSPDRAPDLRNFGL